MTVRDSFVERFGEANAAAIEAAAILAGLLEPLPPLDLCGEQSPKGSWRCIRAPHESEWCVAGQVK